MPSTEIVNLIGNLDFRRELELSAIEDLLNSSSSVSNVEYDPSDVHWLQSYFQSSNENTERYVAFYRSGSCTIVGCSSITELESIVSTVNEAMNPVVLDSMPQVEIKNVVLSGEINEDLDLETLAVAAGLENVEYEPEQFPGLIYRLSGATILVFSNGKIIVTGLDDTRSSEEIFKIFRDELDQWGFTN